MIFGDDGPEATRPECRLCGREEARWDGTCLPDGKCDNLEGQAKKRADDVRYYSRDWNAALGEWL